MISSWPLHIDDSPRRTVSRIAAVARRLQRREGLQTLIVDYLQLLTPEDSRAPREQQVAAMSRQLKLLAKELNIPVVALAQLNRSIESRDDKEPRLSDLRESGAIEQDADIVLFLDRPAEYRKDADSTLATVKVAKNRSGKRSNINLRWHAETMTFDSVPLDF
ncbi:MAG: DnaB-like helicase C-terminal domain-containing protein [Planctomycetaceae bacterium]